MFAGGMGKTTESFPEDKLRRWIITKSKVFMRKGIGKISRSVRAYVYLVLTFQVQVRSCILGVSVSVVDSQQSFTARLLRACIIKIRIFKRHEDLYASK